MRHRIGLHYRSHSGGPFCHYRAFGDHGNDHITSLTISHHHRHHHHHHQQQQQQLWVNYRFRAVSGHFLMYDSRPIKPFYTAGQVLNELAPIRQTSVVDMFFFVKALLRCLVRSDSLYRQWLTFVSVWYILHRVRKKDLQFSQNNFNRCKRLTRFDTHYPDDTFY